MRLSEDSSDESLGKDGLDEKVAYWIRSEVRAISAYHVPEAQDLIKLDAMENPYSWPQTLKQQWLDVLRDVSLNRYPDPAAQSLKVRLRTAMQVPRDMSIILGNGSDELIQIICMAVAGPQRVILAAEPSFVMYRMIANMTGMQYVGVPLRQDFNLDTQAFLEAIEQHRPAVVFIAYPNNPTGNLFAQTDIERIIEASPGIVVLDEAYHAFAGSSFMSALNDYDNLLVMRTVSKMGLAGLRLGLLAGNSRWLDEFDKVRLPYNINILTQASADFALTHHQVLEEQTRQICADREALYEAMLQIEQLTCYPTQANFILFRVQRGQADAVFQALLAKGILIKNLSIAAGLLNNCLRVTVGTAEENAAFLKALKEVLLHS